MECSYTQASGAKLLLASADWMEYVSFGLVFCALAYHQACQTEKMRSWNLDWRTCLREVLGGDLSEAVRKQMETQRTERTKLVFLAMLNFYSIGHPLVFCLRRWREYRGLEVVPMPPVFTLIVALVWFGCFVAHTRVSITASVSNMLTLWILLTGCIASYTMPKEFFPSFAVLPSLLLLFANLMLPTMLALRLNFGTTAANIIAAWLRSDIDFRIVVCATNVHLAVLVMSTSVLYHVHRLDILAAKQKVEVRNIEEAHRAVHRLLKARCDAVVQLDIEWRICATCPQFASMLDVGCPVPQPLEGIHFTELILSNEDRLRFERCCAAVSSSDVGNMTPLQDSPLAEVFHVTLHNRRGATFDARLFHVCLPNQCQLAAHLVGICRETHASAIEPMDPQHSFPFAQKHCDSASTDSESSASKSTHRGKVRNCPVRAAFDALSSPLAVFDHTDAWEQMLGSIDAVPDIDTLLGQEIANFTSWLQPIVNRASNGSWVYRINYKRLTVRNRRDGCLYSANFVLTLPDPLIAYAPEDGPSYAATLSLENLRLSCAQPRGTLRALEEE